MGLNKRLIGAGAVGSGALTPSENFKTVTYDGNGGTNNITVGFQPDWVWIKERGPLAEQSNIYDSTRGVQKFIVSNSNAAEVTGSTGRLNAFNSDGFTVGSDNEINDTGSTYVAWCWKANGGTTSSNTDGNITSTVQANTNAGFSIVKYTANGNNNSTIGHGLGAAPEMILIKKLTATGDWITYHQAVGTGNFVYLNRTDAELTQAGIWSSVGSSTFNLISGYNDYNQSGQDYIAYCFAPIDGFSKFGSYTGNGSDNGPIVEIGFEPAFIMIKDTSEAHSWTIHDNKRDTTNPRKKYVLPSASNVEAADLNGINFYSNGFQLLDDYQYYNKSGNTYIYMAFAADPDTEAPTLASSFNIETYTGTGAAQSISGLGFSPSLVWLKGRSFADNHNIADTVRGATKFIFPNLDSNEFTNSGYLTSFDSDGFSLGNDGSINASGETLVAWSWKADDNESTIEEVIADVDAKAIYTLESNANDVTGNYNATASGITYSSGKFGNAATYSGTNASSGSKIYVSNNIYGSSTSTFTVSLWIKCTNTSGEIPISGNGGTIGGTTGYAIYLNSGKLALTFRTNPNQNFYADTTSINDDAWHHIALTCNEGDFVLYLDNSVNASGTTSNWSGNPTPTYDTYFGNRWNRNESGVLAGQIDQIRIYDSPLTAASITNLYNETQAQNSTLDIGTQAIVSAQSIVSVNSNAGFSIVKWTGDGNASTQVPHGLSATPNMIISKDLSNSKTWQVYHSGAGSGAKFGGHLDSSAAFNTSAGTNGGWDTPTSTVLKFSNGSSSINNLNQDGAEIIAYCFHDVAGYQKFGSYTGNGSSSGPTITTNFKPDFVLIKRTDGANSWAMVDSRRGGDQELYANLNDADNTFTAVDFQSNGFQIINTANGYNANGSTYIYWAIAKNVPSNTTLANSFKAVTYSGTGASQAITTGFTPDLVWIKRRNATDLHVWTDSVRGTDKQLFSNQTDAQSVTNTRLTSFDTNGFTLSGSGTRVNESGGTYVAWAWKAGNTWQSNLDGSINSITNTNTANGFSVVKYTGDGNSARTVGHGLTAKCDLVIIKGLDSADKWVVQLPQLGDNARCVLEGAAGKTDDSTTAQAGNATVFGIGGDNAVNKSGDEFIAYCWHSVSGYSKIGTFSGNSSTQSITGVGFQPDWVMIKRTDGTENWYIQDSARGSTKQVYANLNSAEYDETGAITSFDSDGWTMGSYNGINNSGETYLYMAFKE